MIFSPLLATTTTTFIGISMNGSWIDGIADYNIDYIKVKLKEKKGTNIDYCK